MRPARAALALWVLAFSFYGLTGPGHSSFADGFVLLQATRSLLDHGDVSIDPQASPHELTRARGPNGRWYPKFAPGMIAANLPAVVLGRMLFPAPTIGGEPADPLQRDEFWAQGTSAAAGASIVVLLFLAGLRLGASPRLSLGIAAAAGAGSPLWPYAGIDATETLQGALLLGAVFPLLRREPRSISWVAAGSCLGGAILVKLVNVAVLPWFCAAALLSRSDSPPRERLARLALPVLLALGAFALWNVLRFGDPLQTGYGPSQEGFHTPFLEGLGTLVLSPSFGLLPFWPVAPIALAGGWRLVRHRPLPGAVVVGSTVTMTLLYAMWWAPWGMLWGPRFLVPVVPWLALSLLVLLVGAGRWLRRLTAVLLLAGALVQLVPVGFGFWTHVAPIWEKVQVAEPKKLFTDPRIAPLRIGAWWGRITVLHIAGRDDASMRALRHPPWHDAYPWKNSDAASSRLAMLRGFDVWTLPEGWRLSRLHVPGEGTGPAIPVSEPVFWILLVTAAGGLASLIPIVTRDADAGFRRSSP